LNLGDDAGVLTSSVLSQLKDDQLGLLGSDFECTALVLVRAGPQTPLQPWRHEEAQTAWAFAFPAADEVETVEGLAWWSSSSEPQVHSGGRCNCDSGCLGPFPFSLTQGHRDAWRNLPILPAGHVLLGGYGSMEASNGSVGRVVPGKAIDARLWNIPVSSKKDAFFVVALRTTMGTIANGKESKAFQDAGFGVAETIQRAGAPRSARLPTLREPPPTPTDMERLYRFDL
jgi:hypothetical protein